MKAKHISIWTLLLGTLLACKQKKQKPAIDLIDREKIDAAFGRDVSQVKFDHLYVVLDSLTYANFTTNESSKKTYASIDKGLPDFMPIDSTTTTCYLRGHQHYLEVLGPNNAYDEPVGKSGIGFSLQNHQEHFHLGVTPKLKKDGNAFLSATETVTMPIEQHEQTWFKAFYTPGKETGIATWYGFYDPVFLYSLYAKEHKTYARESFLKDAYDNKRLFQGIKAIEMVCTSQDYNRIAQEMRHLGCELLKKEKQVLTIASGDISITLEPSNKIPFSRITKIFCHLNDTDNTSIRFGNLLITNRGKESIWNFEDMYTNELLNN